MKIKIGKTERTLHLGLAFINYLDNRYTHKFAEVEFGFGIGKTFLLLSNFNPVAVANFIMAGTCTDEEPLTLQEVEDEMMGWSSERLQEVASNFIDTLTTNSMTQPQVAQLEMVIAVMDAAQQAKEPTEPTAD